MEPREDKLEREEVRWSSGRLEEEGEGEGGLDGGLEGRRRRFR